jgi:hypothetical protein
MVSVAMPLLRGTRNDEKGARAVNFGELDAAIFRALLFSPNGSDLNKPNT